MKNILILLISIILISGCITQKRCDQKFPPINIVQTKYVHDSIWTREVIRDTVILVERGKDTTIYNTDTLYIKNGLANSREITTKGLYSQAWAQIINSKLNLRLRERDTLFSITLPNAIKERDSYRLKLSEMTREQTKVLTKNSKMANFSLWYFWITISLGLGALIYKYRKLIFKLFI